MTNPAVLEFADQFKAMVAAYGDTPLITIDLDPEGRMNSDVLQGRCVGVYSAAQNTFRGAMLFRSPCGEPEHVSSCSIVCTSCCLGSHVVLGATNLLSLFRDRYKVENHYTLVSSDGQTRGTVRLSIDASIAREGQTTKIRGTLAMYGDYDPLPPPSPKRMLAHSPGYAVYLRQVAVGEIEGLSAYPLMPDSTPNDGRAKGYVLGRRRYLYDTDLVLPFPEVQNYYLSDLSIEIAGGFRRTQFAGRGYYTPLEALSEADFTAIGAAVGA